nr:RHS repeat-associated core domain-containing protein [Orenia metallireducens]
MTDASANVVMDQDYLPFGGDLARPNQIEIQNDTEESYKYTGQKQVVSIGLYYYGARYYDPEIGRFTREDSYRGELDKPQTQHLYIYVTNNSLKYVDPTGHYLETVWDATSFGVGLWSLKSSIRDRDWLGAGLDTVGLIADGAATILPIIPGGASQAIKAARFAKQAKRASDVADVLGGVREIKHGLEKGSVVQTGLGVVQAGFGARSALSSEVAEAAGDVGKLNKVNNLDVDNGYNSKIDLQLFAKKSGEYSLLPNEGMVGSYGRLDYIGVKGDNLTPHHMPSAKYIEQHGVNYRDGISMFVEQPYPGSGGRHRLTKTYGRNMTDIQKQNYYNLSPRDALAYDIRDLRKIYMDQNIYTSEIRSGLLEVIQQNKSDFPDLYKK